MLPPGLDNRSLYKYGKLTVKVKANVPSNTPLRSAELTMLGMRRKEQRQLDSNKTASFEFDIATNLWHFYAYLNDVRAIKIQLKAASGQVYNSEMHLNLMPSKQVLNQNIANIQFLFQNNSYLLNSKSRGDIFDSRFSKLGYAQFQLQLTFHEGINRALFKANLIDFDEILVIDEISPISSTIELNNVTLVAEQAIPSPISQSKEPVQTYNVPESLRYLEEEQLPTVYAPNAAETNQDERMMEDDIDRLIAQMQNKPYDSSKYMEDEPKKENFNQGNFSLKTSQSQKYEKPSFEKPSSVEKYAPKNLPMKNSNNRSQFNVSPSKFAYTVSQPLNYQPAPQLQSNFSNTQKISQQNCRSDKRNGLIKLKVHEFTMSKMQRQLTLLLKIYLNEDTDQFYSINGLKQGETIVFNSNLKISQNREINSIKFVLIDAYDMKTTFAHGNFEMDRLFSQNPTKGIFMVSLLSPQVSQNVKTIRMEQQNLVRVTPSVKSLRIQLEYEQPIEIVQLFLSFSDFSALCRKICYKIPLTKETIEFRVSELNNSKHINIFPHNRSSSNRSSDKIIVEFWGNTELIGFDEINLKPIANTNQSIINCSLEPILLYDQNREVSDIKTGKNNTSYWLKLCYGTVAQVQGILNRQDKRQKRVEQAKKPIQVETHLGIYIKEAKGKREVEIQVDEGEMSSMCRGSQKNLLQLKQEELPDEDDEYEWEHHKQPSQNEFISQSMQQKYIFEKQTAPILKMNTAVHSENGSRLLQLSGTIKQKQLSSLTKQFQQEIKEALSDFVEEEVFASFKQQCMPYLLYNFIESSTLTDIMRKFGINQRKIDQILRDIILITNDMININMMYDMIFALSLQGEVKQKFIDDSQVGRYCLMNLYKRLAEMEEDEILFDQNTQFDESRKMFQKVGFKITMREFNLIHMFINKKKESGMMDRQIKGYLLQQLCHKTTQIEVKKAKEKEIISNLYQPEWDEDDDFFICNINQHEIVSEVASNNQNISQNDVSTSTVKQNYQKTALFKYPTRNDSSISKLESGIVKSIQVKRQIPFIVQELKDIQKPQCNHRANFRLIIEGFQSCVETTECLLNIPLKAPQLKITCKNQADDNEFWIKKTQGKDCYQIELFIKQSEFLDGSIELTDNVNPIARCNVSVMANMKSCYSLKNIETLQFCGILKLLLCPFENI